MATNDATKVRAPSRAKPARDAKRKSAKGAVRLTRLEARVPEQLNDKILKAASIKGTSKTDFLLYALDEVASRVILEESILQLHIEDQKALAAVIIADKPCPPVRKMTRLRRYGEEYSKRVERK